MRSLNTRNFMAASAVLIFALLGAGNTVLAQGKGNGGGHGGGRGNPHMGGPPQGQMQRGPQRQMQRPQGQMQPQMQRAQRQDQRPQRQMQRMQPQMQRREPQFQGRGRPEFQRQRQQQVDPVQRMGRAGSMQFPRQVWPQNRGNPIEKGRRQDRQAWQQAPRRFEPQPGSRPGRGRNRDNWQNGYPAPGLLGPPIKQNRAWPNNYGYDRSSEAHFRNAERKALRNEARSAPYDQNYYYPLNRIDRRQQDRWRNDVLRSVVASAFTGGDYYSPYYDTRYAYTAPYYPTSYISGYYAPYRWYPAYSGTVTYYNFYSPYDDYSYSGYGYSAPYYTEYYTNDIGLPYYYADDLGLPYLSVSSSFGGFVSRLFSELIAYGYNEGYRDALYARRHAHNIRTTYYDPYDPYILVSEDVDFEDIGYNPYSCIAEDRRYVSQGYELGYQDALYNRVDYDPYYYEGDIDLVSVLISTSL